MKRKYCYICFAVLLLFFIIGCKKSVTETKKDSNTNTELVSNDFNEEKNSEEKSTDTESQDAIDYQISSHSDYMAIYPEDMYDIAEIVVTGHFGEKVGTYVSETFSPVTQIEFECEEVLKGNVNSPNIIAGYYGGTVPLSEYIASISETAAEKMNIDDLTPSEISRATVTCVETEESVSVNKNDTYMLFLAYHQSKDTYFILCDTYGACKLKGTQIYSFAEKTYVDTDFY